MIDIALLAAVVAAIVLAARRRNATSSSYSATAPPFGSSAVAGRSPLQDKLDDWVAAELIDADQADALLAYELQSSPARTSRVPLAAEAVGYIGSGLVLAAVALLIGNRWDAMATPARVVALAAPTIVAMLAGWWTGRSDEPALQRLGSVLWLLAVVGVAGLAGEVWVDAIHDGDPPDHHTAIFIGSSALLAAVPTWWVRRVELQQLAMFGATIATSLGIVDTIAAGRDRAMSPLAAGLVLAALGASWVAASLARRLPPALLANVLGSALILVAAQVVRADNDQAGLWLGLVASVALMATGVARSVLEIMFVGTAGLFLWTPQIALFYLEDTLGAEATLFVIGTVLIVLAGVLTRVYPWVKARHSNRSPKPGETSPRADKHQDPLLRSNMEPVSRGLTVCEGHAPPEGWWQASDGLWYRPDVTTAETDKPPTPSEHHPDLRGSGAHHRLPLIVGGSVIGLVLVALVSQWFGSTESDRRGPVDDDRGPVVDEEWTIAPNEQSGGIYTLVMIKTFSPLEEADIEDLGGRLVWQETEIELCSIGIRAVGDGFVQIGDIFQTTEGCDDSMEMQERFDQLGAPETACVYVRADGVDDEYCAPLSVGTAEDESEP